jgi:hypothetical protein
MIVAAGAHAAETTPEPKGEGPSLLLLLLPQGDDPAPAGVLEGRLAEAGVRVRPAYTLAAEASRDPEAEALEEAARSLELEMRFREAAEVWRSLRDRLLSGVPAIVAPAHLAEVQVALAASWVESGELELARLEFRRALGLDPRFTPGPAYSPRVRAFFAEAGASGPGLPPPPADAAIDDLLLESGTDAFLWIAIGRDDAGWILVRRLRLAGEDGATAEVRRRLSEPFDAAGPHLFFEADTVSRELGLIAPGDPVVPPPTPWYRHRWVPVAAAGAATVVAAGLLTAHALSPPTVDVVVRH